MFQLLLEVSIGTATNDKNKENFQKKVNNLSVSGNSLWNEDQVSLVYFCVIYTLS